MNEREDKIIPNEEIFFYYAKCVHCGFEFAVSPYLGERMEIEGGQFQRMIDEDDFVKIYCPSCGKSFTLTIAKAPKVFIEDASELFEERDSYE